MDDTVFKSKLRPIVSNLYQLKETSQTFYSSLKELGDQLSDLTTEVEKFIDNLENIPQKWYRNLHILKEAEREVFDLRVALWKLAEDEEDSYVESLHKLL